MQQSRNENKALKLDSSFRPIEIVDSVEALVLCLVGKAYAVESYAKQIHSISQTFQLPAVIVLRRYVKMRFKKVACTRKNIIWRDDSQCQYCTKYFEEDKLTIDHVKPRSRGGKNTWLNLVTACKKCNQKKGNKTPEEANMFLLKPPKEPKPNIFKNIGKNSFSSLWEDYLW